MSIISSLKSYLVLAGNKIKQNGIGWLLRKLLSKLGHWGPLVFWILPAMLFWILPAMLLSKIASARSRTPRQVVFVCASPHIRIMKMASALRDKGWHVVLLYRDPLKDWEGEFFDVTMQYINGWHALFIGAQYTPIVYHVLAGWEFKTAHIFIKNKPGKIVFDSIDVLTGMLREEYLKKYKVQVELEQYCYRFADGICCRDLRPQYLKKKLGFKLPPNILFPEYCWPPDRFQRQPKLKDGIHVAYVGGLVYEPENSIAFQYDLAVLLSKAKIHFHLYHHQPEYIPLLRSYMADRLSHEGDSSYVHIHDTVPASKLLWEISQYHFGLLISTKKASYHDYHQSNHRHVEDYCCAAKIFDYFDAGLFVLIQKGRFWNAVVERPHLGKVVMSLEEIVSFCQDPSNSYEEIPKQYSVSNNIGRLIEFYESLAISSGKNSPQYSRPEKMGDTRTGTTKNKMETM